MHLIPGMVPNFTKGSITLYIKGTGIVQGMIRLFCLLGTVFLCSNMCDFFHFSQLALSATFFYANISQCHIISN